MFEGAQVMRMRHVGAGMILPQGFLDRAVQLLAPPAKEFADGLPAGHRRPDAGERVIQVGRRLVLRDAGQDSDVKWPESLPLRVRLGDPEVIADDVRRMTRAPEIG